ncbi:MAG: hypothetical protein KatS3mg008_2170 [Acidimicrobiales bacterium]|nr:MAG: hypothetical protein KatS3mg008_2170 [Acidimicrobiales bacterium]
MAKNGSRESEREWLVDKIESIFNLKERAQSIGSTRSGQAIGAWLIKWNLDVFSPILDENPIYCRWVIESELDGKLIPAFLDNWSMDSTSRTDQMAPGHPVIMWITGSKRGKNGMIYCIDPETEGLYEVEPGLVGVGVVGSQRALGKEGAGDPNPGDYYYSIGIPLLEEPIARSEIRMINGWKDADVFRMPQMRNPLIATVEQWEALRVFLVENGYVDELMEVLRQ